jgi:RNA polymerase sigma factor (sigma-70 family)
MFEPFSPWDQEITMNSRFSTNPRWPEPYLGNEGDEVLVATAKLGDERALTELWRRHAKVTYKILWRITGNREDAEDALQETLLRSFVHLKSFNGRSKFSTWLISIATNTALTQLRRKRQRPEVLFSSYTDDVLEVLPNDSVDVETRFAHQERTDVLRAAVRRLSPSLQYVIELRNKHEYSIEQIAEMTGLSIPAIKSRMHRAKSALRQMWTNKRYIREDSRPLATRHPDSHFQFTFGISSPRIKTTQKFTK